MKKLFDWLDHRAGWRGMIDAILRENLPGGARWQHVWSATVVFILAAEAVTGFFLWLAYSPGTQTAWESVYFIQHVMSWGWLLRGLHHFMADVLVIVLGLHVMQMIIGGAYKAPRELNYCVGLCLVLVVLATALTGYLLPWDQDGYWGTKVRLGYLALSPVVGPGLQKLAVGGPAMGHYTLTRFFAFHAGLFPATLLGLAVAHSWLLRRHGRAAPSGPPAPDAHYWPDQALRDGVACLAVLATVLILTLRGSDGVGPVPRGAALGSPADPFEHFEAARPEWYFRFLHELLKSFPGKSQVVGAVYIPSLILLVLFVMPYVGRWRLGHRFNLGVLGCLVAGGGVLTVMSFHADAHDPAYRAAVAEAAREAARVRVLAQAPEGIPVSGAVTLLREDPLTQGPLLFASKCASCHRYGGTDGTGLVPTDPQSASDLKGFASREWLAGLLDPARIATTNYFGATSLHNGKMVRFVKKDVAGYSPAQKEQLGRVIEAVSAEAQLPAQAAMDARDAGRIKDGQGYLRNEIKCTDCHQFREEDATATAPDLTGYGSRQWLIDFISQPNHVRFYGDLNDRMPSFGSDHVLTPQEIGLIADWLRGSWYEPQEAAR